MMPRLVLLHGFTGSPASWDEVVARLEPRPEILAPVLSGHDPEQPLAGGESFAAETERLLALIVAWAGPGPVHIAGYSLGARLALALAARNPEMLSSATLIGVNPGITDWADRETRIAHDAELIDLLDEGIEPFVDAWERLPLWRTQSRLPDALLAAQRLQRLRHHPDGLKRSLRVVGLGQMPDLRPQLGRVQLPVALMVGAEDPKFLPLARETAALLPDARVVVVEGAGHNIPLERPEAVAEELNRKIR